MGGLSRYESAQEVRKFWIEGYARARADGSSERYARAYADGYAKGVVIGYEKGILTTCLRYVHQGLLTVRDAAGILGIHEEEMRRITAYIPWQDEA